MKKIKYIFLSIVLLTINLNAGFFTPGTGVKWNLNDLVANSSGAVTFSAGEYFVNDTIFVALNDTLIITENAIVKFAAATYFDINGTLIINPPSGVTFTAQDTSVGYSGMRIDSSNTSSISKLTFEYAVSLRLSDCTITIDSSIFRNNNVGSSTTFGNGAISLFRAKPIITNSQFINNRRAAIQGGANIANAPVIIGNTFIGNNTTNQNVPQINLGTTGTDTVKILNNNILRASTNSGGIGFLPIGNVYAVISGNVIKNNRYGLTFNGGSNINALVSYNEIDSNNTQNNPNLGGSGIAFTGGADGNHQNTIVTGNLIRWNLWGITIQNRSRPNIGNITNADTTDDGKNYFFMNNNANEPLIDLYNNSVDSIYAQNNFWGTENPDSVEFRIFHQVDNPALGKVNFNPPIIPVELYSFSASVVDNKVLLEWQTATETNNMGFEIQRTSPQPPPSQGGGSPTLADGGGWEAVGFVNGSGTTIEPKLYTFTDNNTKPGKYSYRLKQIDFDGNFEYFDAVEIEIAAPTNFVLEQNYPNPFNPVTKIQYVIASDNGAKQSVLLKVYDALGKEVATLVNEPQEAGNYQVEFSIGSLSSGVYYYTLSAGNFIETRKMILMK